MTEELSRDARNLIALARGGEPAPSDGELEKVRRGVLAASLAAGTVLGSGSAVAAGAKTLTATLVTAGVKGIVLGAVVTVGANAVSGYVESRSAPPPRPVASAALAQPERPVALNEAREAPPLTSAVEPTEREGETKPGVDGATRRRVSAAAGGVAAAHGAVSAPAAASGAAPAAAVAAFEPASSALAFELDVLRRAQAELHAERGAQALSILDENAARLASGQLGQERLAVEVLAACQAGQLERARRAARRLHGDNAATPAAARIRASCAGAELP